MNVTSKQAKGLVIAGLVAMLLGAIDPLEGSIAVLIGVALAALGAHLGHRMFERQLTWAFALTFVGVAIMWGLSAIGGVGGSTGRPLWWAIIVLPYPIGWMVGLVKSIQSLRHTPA